MKTKTTITLQSLHCIKESDGSGHSEPYIWPVLLKIDDDTLSTPRLVSLITRANGNERMAIKNGIKAGESALIPPPLNTLNAIFENGQEVQRLILDVLVWENDETPEDSVREGFQAFALEFEDAIRDNLFALASANDEEEESIINAIQKRIEKKVEDAIRNSLSASEKIRAFIGTLNLDDVVGNDFLMFADPLTQPQDFTLSFSNAAAHSGRPTESYEIRGSLSVQPVEEEKCPVQAEAVKDARAQVKGLELRIRSLQNELRHASPQQKSAIVREIRRIRQEELSNATDELNAALKALELCEKRNDLFRGINEDLEVLPIHL